jgi:large subunit ribosomal protein L29
VKPEELRTLDGDELTNRLKGARRELYELRFKLAVGQLDDHRQIRKVRKDIARILTVVHARRLGEEIGTLEEGGAVAVAEAPEDGAETATNEETPEDVEAQGEGEPAPRSRRARPRPSAEDAAAEDGND